MRVGPFELTIRDAAGCAKRETADGYVPLRHGEQYQVGLTNHAAGRCNLKVAIDGTPVGCFQIGPFATATLERPADGDGRFTFYAAESTVAIGIGAEAVPAGAQGLVEVTFTPERDEPRRRLRRGPGGQSCHGFTTLDSGFQDTAVVPVPLRGGGFGAGVTGQSGHSGQRFGVAPRIDEDVSRRAVVTLRLVIDRTAVASSGPRPLPGRLANAVPPPVG